MFHSRLVMPSISVPSRAGNSSSLIHQLHHDCNTVVPYKLEHTNSGCSENCSVAHQHSSPKFPLIHTQDPDDHNDDGNDGNDVEDGSAGGIVSEHTSCSY